MRLRVPRTMVGLVLALVGFHLGTPAVFADRGAILYPRSGTALRAGELVQIRWAGLPAEVEEMELLLSLDGGMTFPVQLTPQLDPLLGALAWQVPNLRIGRARLRLRVGVGREEVESEPSGVFSIEDDTGSAMARLWYDFGQLWIQESGWEPPDGAPVPKAGSLVPRCFLAVSDGVPSEDEREPLEVEVLPGRAGGAVGRADRRPRVIPLMTAVLQAVPQRR